MVVSRHDNLTLNDVSCCETTTFLVVLLLKFVPKTKRFCGVEMVVRMVSLCSNGVEVQQGVL